MPRIVESKTCPTCGHDKGTVQKFEIPEIPVLDTASLDKGIERIAETVKTSNTSLLESISKMTPNQEANYCQAHPDQCQHRREAEDAKAAAARLKAQVEGFEAHTLIQPVTPEDLDYLASDKCPNGKCSNDIKAWAIKQAEKQGYQKSAPKANIPVKPAKPKRDGLLGAMRNV